MLTGDQIAAFKRDGVLPLRGLFSRAEVHAWREQVLDYFERPESPQAWLTALQTHGESGFHLSDDPTPHSHSVLKEVYASLHATADWHGENELVTRRGHEQTVWLGARAPHIDFPLYAPLRTLANIVIYLSDVRSHGGAFIYWPGSHRIAWDYFQHNPDDYMSRGERSQDQTFALLKREMIGEPVEFVGGAGDALIWHSFIFHSATVNVLREPRLALFGRWGVPLAGEPIYDFDADMWTYWNFTGADPYNSEVGKGAGNGQTAANLAKRAPNIG
jgi:hypothetical protein